MVGNWENNKAFCDLAEMVWEEDYKLAKAWSAKGRAAARSRMRHRYQGFRLMVTMSKIRNAARESSLLISRLADITPR